MSHRSLYDQWKRQHHGLHPDALRFLQCAPVRHLHPGHVLEADDRDGRLGWPGRRHAGRHHRVGFGQSQSCRRLPASRARLGIRRREYGVRRGRDRERDRLDVHRAETGIRTAGPGLLRNPERGTPRSAGGRDAVVPADRPAGPCLPVHGRRPQHPHLRKG